MMRITLLLLVVCFVGITTGCPPPSGGCGVNFCCTSGTPNSPFRAFYNDGFVHNGIIGGEGRGTYPLRGYMCHQIGVLHGTNFGRSLSVSPSSVDLTAPPPAFTITGQDMSGEYGMPKVEYFDNYGYLIGSVTATAVASDGTWVQANTPDLSSVYSGTYQVKVTNMRSDGYYLELVGSGPVNAWGRDEPPDDDEGGECCGRGCYCY